MSKEFLGENISLEPIGKNIELYVSKEHTFGTDAILLSSFAAPTSKEKAVDLGTGCGIIPFLMKRDKPTLNIVGLEIADNAINLANMSKEKNFAEDNSIFFLKGDIKNPFENLKKAEYTLVTCNPPYKKGGAGILSETSADKVARHETLCNLEDVVKAAAGLLKFGGRFALCHRPERLAEIFYLMRLYKIEPKRLRLVAKTTDKEPWLVLVEGRLGGGVGLRVLPTLYLYNEKGELTEEMLGIYGEYANQNKLKNKK